MQKLVLDFLMNTRGQSSLFKYHLFRRNSFSRLYYILPDCFKPYNDLINFTQYMLHLNLTGKVLRGVCIMSVNTFLFLSEFSSISIASFHLFQSERFLHSVMVLGSGSFKKFSTMIVEKHMFAIVVLRSYTFPELV
jgi:hypothetical protein